MYIKDVHYLHSEPFALPSISLPVNKSGPVMWSFKNLSVALIFYESGMKAHNLY